MSKQTEAKLAEENKALQAELDAMKAEQAVKNAKPKSELPAALQKDYELVGWVGSHRQSFGSRIGIVDLSTITKQRVETLIARGFKKIVRKK